VKEDDKYALGYPISATASIVDETRRSTPTLSLLVKDALAHETEKERAVFALEISSPVNHDLTIHYQLSGSAIPESDYQSLNGEAVLLANQSSIEIPIIPIDDNFFEGYETINITLTPASDYQVIVRSFVIPLWLSLC
jgi:hypothetical protein